MAGERQVDLAEVNTTVETEQPATVSAQPINARGEALFRIQTAAAVVRGVEHESWTSALVGYRGRKWNFGICSQKEQNAGTRTEPPSDGGCLET